MTERKSTLTSPECGYRATEEMPTDACQYFYGCRGCGAILKPFAGDCCVFCSYGTIAVTANPNRLVGPKMKKDGTVSGAALLIRMWKTLTFLLDPQSHEPQVAILVYEQKY